MGLSALQPCDPGSVRRDDGWSTRSRARGRPVFTDVSGSERFAGAVGALYQIGVAQGGAEGEFVPGSEISRQQAAALTMRAVAYRLPPAPDDGTGGEDPAEPGFALMTDAAEAALWLQGFKDRGAIASAHSLAVANAFRAGVVSGFADQRFYPLLSLTRAQAAGILYEALVMQLVISELPAPVEAEVAYPTLKKGTTGPVVAWFERRLAALSYRPGTVDGLYDGATTDAVMAFQKVERLQRTGTATDAVQRRLVDAVTPSARRSAGGTRVEIDLTKQVLFLVKAGRVEYTIPIASGAEGAVPPPAPSPSRESFPTGGRAISDSSTNRRTSTAGTPSTARTRCPPIRASHGCVRVAVSTMDWLYPLLPIGTRVDIYY